MILFLCGFKVPPTLVVIMKKKITQIEIDLLLKDIFKMQDKIQSRLENTLKQRKKDGYKFITNKEIDDIIDSAIKEESDYLNHTKQLDVICPHCFKTIPKVIMSVLNINNIGTINCYHCQKKYKYVRDNITIYTTEKI